MCERIGQYHCILLALDVLTGDVFSNRRLDKTLAKRRAHLLVNPLLILCISLMDAWLNVRSDSIIWIYVAERISSDSALITTERTCCVLSCCAPGRLTACVWTTGYMLLRHILNCTKADHRARLLASISVTAASSPVICLMSNFDLQCRMNALVHPLTLSVMWPPQMHLTVMSSVRPQHCAGDCRSRDLENGRRRSVSWRDGVKCGSVHAHAGIECTLTFCT